MSRKEPTYRMSPRLEKLLAEVEKGRAAGENFTWPLKSEEEVQKYLDSLKKKGDFSEPLSVEETIKDLKRLSDSQKSNE